MKLSMERSALLRAMSRAQSVVERRNTIPILSNVLIEAEGDRVSFRATDLDIEVIDKAPAMVSRAGATTVARPHAARDRPQAARRGDGRARRRRHLGAARRQGRPLALQPRHPAARGLPDHGERRVPVQLRLPGADAAAAVRQGQVRHLHRGDPLLPERRLHARRHRPGRAGAALRGDRRPPAGADRRGAAAGRRGAARGHRAAQDRGRAPQAPRRRRGDDRRLGQRDQGALRHARR